jgi:hypothetical protein
MKQKDFAQWEKNIPSLYDFIHISQLDFPSPTIEWYPTIEKSSTGTSQKV